MRWKFIAFLRFVLLAVAAATLAAPSSASGQVFQPQASVVVDAEGVLAKKVYADPGAKLMRQRFLAAKTSQSRKLLPVSQLRKVSLNRLEEAVRDSGGVPTEEMRYLAGLLQLRYVFYFPESKDIVLAGPAEGWVADSSGRAVGITSRRTVLQLQDLVVALRAFSPGREPTHLIGCSIDPTFEGLVAMQAFRRSEDAAFTTPQQQIMAAWVTENLRNSLGSQKVTFVGVSPKTHFAGVMAEAAYRMKLIGLGLEPPPVEMVTFVGQVRPGQISREAPFHWHFLPDYQCVRLAYDNLAMELVGDGVRLAGEEELVTFTGEHRAAGRSNQASRAFATSFTKQYSALADRSPVFAELRSLIHLAVAAAHIQQQDYYGRAGWKMETFGNEKEFPVETYNALNQAESRGEQWMTPAGGGVHTNVRRPLKTENAFPERKTPVAKVRNEVRLDLEQGQWWWD